jgi:2-polyprenyl-3-methyl-5-hydroxy-6-metoxy-1,4-benzoquinol methylase
VKCRFCGADLRVTFLDLGSAPPSNAYLNAQQLVAAETWFPLRLVVCEACWLVQTQDFAGREALFTDDYAYFSSYSESWLEHCRRYVERVVARFGLGANSLVAEIAANDGYLLQYVQQAGVPCYGIEPTASTATAARARGIEIIETFFGAEVGAQLAQVGRQADLIIANNVLAHVPNVNDFVAGFAKLLRPQGVATFEFPHLLRMVELNQFDTAYHEHFSYFSFNVVERVLRAHGLAVFDVEALPTHGGSLRIYAQHVHGGRWPLGASVTALLQQEQRAGVGSAGFYAGFQERAVRVKLDFMSFLIDARRQGRSVAAYGAAAKGNTLLNFAGVRPDLLPYVVDRNPAKQHRWMPGSRIPIVGPERLFEQRPQVIAILPWNIRDEVVQQLSQARSWGARFLVAVPQLELW